MKKLILTLVLLFSFTFFWCGCNNERLCPNPNAKVFLVYRDNYIPYQGNEKLKFLHNNLDTQIFIGQSKETYYTTEGASNDGECPKDYEDVRVKFLNQTTNDIFTLAYERAKTMFSPNPSQGYSDNLYTYYKLTYKNKTYSTEYYNSNYNQVFINNVGYIGVAYIGTDSTSNYVAYRWGKGILRIRVNNENWDLIP
ncbi:MAG: hypothetical protein ACHQK8_00415 [Bacteroidia bacterium]